MNKNYWRGSPEHQRVAQDLWGKESKAIRQILAAKKRISSMWNQFWLGEWMQNHTCHTNLACAQMHDLLSSSMQNMKPGNPGTYLRCWSVQPLQFGRSCGLFQSSILCGWCQCVSEWTMHLWLMRRRWEGPSRVDKCSICAKTCVKERSK